MAFRNAWFLLLYFLHSVITNCNNLTRGVNYKNTVPTNSQRHFRTLKNQIHLTDFTGKKRD